MYVQKRRTINRIQNDELNSTSTDSLEQNTHKCWRRFMNARATDRAYVPTNHGRYFLRLFVMIHWNIDLEHAANCITHGVLIIPSMIGAYRLISHATTPDQYWSTIIYGYALIFLFSFSTFFHCSCFHPTYKYEPQFHHSYLNLSIEIQRLNIFYIESIEQSSIYLLVLVIHLG